MISSDLWRTVTFVLTARPELATSQIAEARGTDEPDARIAAADRADRHSLDQRKTRLFLRKLVVQMVCKTLDLVTKREVQNQWLLAFDMAGAIE